ncbi:hypothetical protein HFP89_06265 [Wenzhouxiangella sp. XN79A]|uniref:hypothetical protein n=1 Tax=Wenzhouxiangella sp. XN79A TaxID=2724193 RepID=UPI00144A5FCA|nr:hypothetical protein [Wenzhouxiangella sp. XN79A]NKI34766.1 hypothetical protein [Wenzhouxiangella sp. XN79A]
MNTMHIQRRLLVSAVLGALAVPVTGLAQDAYDYTSVTLPGTLGSQAFGINQRGVLAGNAFAEEGNIGFTYDIKKDKFELVDDVAGFDVTVISAISNRGDLVGSVVDETTGIQSGLMLDKRGNAHLFDHPDAVSGTSARAINSRGTITGIRDSADPMQILAGFIYDSRSETFTDIVPGALTIPQGINARGDVVGSVIFFSENDPCNPGTPAGGIVRYAWYRSAEGDIQYFTVNGGFSSARGLTDSGTIAGFTADPDTGVTQGYVTEIPAGQCQDISVGPEGRVAFPGAVRTFAQSITNSGTVIGQYVDADGIQQTFVATPD